MSAEAVGWVWKHSPYQGASLLVHLAIADVVNDVHGNEFWMSVPNLADKCRVDKRSVFRALAHMQENGFLEKLESGQTDGVPSRYRFLVDKSRWGMTSGHTPVTPGDGGVTSDASEARHGVTQNSIKNPNERAEFSTRPKYGGRFAGELTAIDRCPECQRLTLDCECPRGLQP